MTRMIPIVIILLTLTGCSAGMIHVDSIAPALEHVMDRHDGYVTTGKAPDGSALSDVAKRTQLRSTEQLRAILDAARAKK